MGIDIPPNNRWRRSRTRKINSNWTTNNDGTVVQADIRVYPTADIGVYDVEFDKDMNGISWDTDTHGNYIIVKGINNCESSKIIKSIIEIGDILISINNHVVLSEDYEDVIAFIVILDELQSTTRFRFLRPALCSIATYIERSSLKIKSDRDMFGFMRTVEFLYLEKEHKTSKMHFMIQRDLQWIHYLKAIGGAENLKPAGIFLPSKKLKRMVRSGIPIAFRSLVWQHISLSSLRRRNYHVDYFQELCEMTDAMENKTTSEIEKDVDRTFPDHDFFTGPTSEGIKSLRRVLRAYSVHNPTVGYCQSLNFITGMMLLFMNEEDAFWLLSTVVEELLPPLYFDSSMMDAYIDQLVLTHIISLHLPKIHKALDKHQLQLSLVTLQWCLCLFVNTLPPETTLRVWDILLNEGCIALFRVAVALLKLNEPAICSAKDSSHLYTILTGIGKNMMDADLLIAAAFGDAHTLSAKAASHKRTTSSSSSSSASCRGYGEVPDNLIGFGHAHLGPTTTVTSPPLTPLQSPAVSSENYTTEDYEYATTTTTTTAAVMGNGVDGDTVNDNKLTVMTERKPFAKDRRPGGGLALSPLSPLSPSDAEEEEEDGLEPEPDSFQPKVEAPSPSSSPRLQDQVPLAVLDSGSGSGSGAETVDATYVRSSTSSPLSLSSLSSLSLLCMPMSMQMPEATHPDGNSRNNPSTASLPASESQDICTSTSSAAASGDKDSKSQALSTHWMSGQYNLLKKRNDLPHRNFHIKDILEWRILFRLDVENTYNSMRDIRKELSEADSEEGRGDTRRRSREIRSDDKEEGNIVETDNNINNNDVATVEYSENLEDRVLDTISTIDILMGSE